MKGINWMKIVDLIKDGKPYIKQMIELLQTTFACYANIEDATQEVELLLSEERILLGVVIDDILIGLIGGIPTYNGNVYELHPLVIHHEYKKKGYGTQLIRVFEEEVKKRGAYTIYLGSDDEYNQTSLSNQDLYEDLWDKIKNIKNLNNHPYEFYLKNGFKIVGVVPDANGLGKPDIMMAKRVRDK